MIYCPTKVPRFALRAGLTARPSARMAVRQMVVRASVAETPAPEAGAAAEASAPSGERKPFRKPRKEKEIKVQKEEIAVGKTFKGTVRNLTEYGAFVDIGAQFDGLCHVSNISTSFIRSPADALAVGQEVEVRVLKVEDTGKFAVTMKPEGAENERPKRGPRREEGEAGAEASGDAAARPRQARAPRREDGDRPQGDRPQQGDRPRSRTPRAPAARIGDHFKGVVSRVTDYAVYIKQGERTEASLAREEVPRTDMGLTPVLAELFKEGQEVEARVVEVFRNRIRVSLLTDEQRAAAAGSKPSAGSFTSRGGQEDVQGNTASYMLRAAGIDASKFPERQVAPKAAAPKAEPAHAPAPVAAAAPAPKAEAPKAEPAHAPAPAAAAPAPAAAAAKAPAAKAPAAEGAISAAAVKELREKTGAGMMDCKKALGEVGGDVEKAVEFLRKKGLASADKKAGRVAAEGAVTSYIHAGSRLGVLVEINCETDFVARGERFKGLVADIAMQIAASPSVQVVSVADVPADLLAREKAIEMEKEDLKSKPVNIREKIVQGRLDKMAKEWALLEQPFIKDTDKTVGEVVKAAIAEIGENIQVRRFSRYNLGEGIEKKSVDFASEVAAQTQVKAPEPKKEAPKPVEEAPKADGPKVEVSAAAVKELREKTGAGMMDCKKALAQNDNDVEKSVEFLRKKGLASADKKAGRVAAEGAIGAYIHAGSRLGVMVEVNCETDFVARGDRFRGLVADIAMQIAASPSVQVVSVADVPADLLAREKAIEMEKEDLKSKPVNIREKIVQGRLDKMAKEWALLEQPFIKDTDKTVGEMVKAAISEIGENIQVRRFSRFNLGEGIEKKSVDFAAEVAAQTGGRI